MNETIKIENGKNIIGIFFDGHVEYIKIQKTIAVDWYDNEGSMGKYFILDSDFNKTDELYDFNKILIDTKPEVLRDCITSFLHLFFNGEYHINTTSWKIEYENVHMDYISENNSKIYNYHFLDYNEYNFMFTQSPKLISSNRIEYYKKLINDGVKPKIIVLGNCNSQNPTYYILDGHHKLLAYLSLNQPCEFITIMKTSIEEEKNISDNLFNDYESILTKAQKKDILENHPAFKKNKLD